MADTTQKAPLDIKVPKKNRIRRFSVGDGILLLIMSLLSLSVILPFYNAVLVSLVPQAVYVRSPLLLWPKEVLWDNYRFIFDFRLIWHGIGNSIFITLVGTFYSMLLTVLCAYALTKNIPGRRAIRFLIVFTMYFSGGIIPYFLIINGIGLTNSLWSMILPTGINVFYMLIVSNFFTGIPPSLEESAKIDGAGDFTILIRIILPLSLPILATFALYYAVDKWNEWWHGLLFIRKVEKQPLQLILRQIIQDAQFLSQQLLPGQEKPDVYGDSIKMAAVVVTMFPIMMLYPFLQRYFLSGLTLGAVKE
ncbi:MAG: carbohydrate ABC transporter permease [Clostridiales bacterium]|jgi:putative aldouronate transport system permease protein|nr:carbohydrate ABC transporter permease [Clostridiales bacterium]